MNMDDILHTWVALLCTQPLAEERKENCQVWTMDQNGHKS